MELWWKRSGGLRIGSPWRMWGEVSSGAKAHSCRELNVGAEAPTPKRGPERLKPDDSGSLVARLKSCPPAGRTGLRPFRGRPKTHPSELRVSPQKTRMVPRAKNATETLPHCGISVRNNGF